jgi:hypothetical protein
MGRRETLAVHARQTRDVAADAFYAMDRAQRDTRVRVDAFTNLDAGSPAAQRVRTAFEELTARIDRLSGAYIATLDAHPVEEELSAAQYTAAIGALEAVTRDLRAAADELAAFSEHFRGELERVEQALDRLAPRAVAAAEALRRARSAVDGLTQQGMVAGEAGEALKTAEDAAQVLAQGAARLGIAVALRQAEQVVALADRVTALAEDLPRKRAEASRRQVSLRTRREALAHRADAIPGLLSTLRREYVEGCSRDLDSAPRIVAERLRAADEALAAAGRAAAAGDWDAATLALRAAAGALDAVEERVRAVTARREALLAIEHEPQPRVDRAAFAVRDAQRLVMHGRSLPPAPWAGLLDALAARVQAAREQLGRPRPDYWAVLSELDAVTDETADLVRRFRAAPDR